MSDPAATRGTDDEGMDVDEEEDDEEEEEEDDGCRFLFVWHFLVVCCDGV